MNITHTERVAAIAATINQLYLSKRPFRVYHGSTNSTRILSFKRSEMIDVSALNAVLSIDSSTQTAWVEPNVPMDQLVAATLKQGFIPKVTPEFPGITVGGAIQGGAGESSSFRYGCFNQTCSRYEIILGNGDVVTASPKKHADLYYGTAGSFGTLGVITAAEVQLIPAKRYAVLTYLPVASFDQAVNVITETIKKPYDFIDGIMFNDRNGVIIVGTLSDTATGNVQRFARAHDPWYYLHAQKISHKAIEHTESVPIIDYLFRYDRGAFWMGAYVFELFRVPFNSITRWALNPMLHTRKLYQALQESGSSQQYIVQDLALPADTAVAFMQYINRTLGIYPLWLCPLTPDQHSPLQSNNLETTVGINVGVWGNRIPDRREFIRANRGIEHMIAALGGKKWFYAHSYYTEAEFWKQYDKHWYDGLRRRYHAETLPNIYDKVVVKDMYQVSMKRGALRTFWGQAKLRVSE